MRRFLILLMLVLMNQSCHGNRLSKDNSQNDHDDVESNERKGQSNQLNREKRQIDYMSNIDDDEIAAVDKKRMKRSSHSGANDDRGDTFLASALLVLLINFIL